LNEVKSGIFHGAPAPDFASLNPGYACYEIDTRGRRRRDKPGHDHWREF
jgi:hypothetical protein